MEEIKNTINNLDKIDFTTITYNEKWERKNSNNMTIVTFSFTQDISREYYYYKLNNDVPTSALNQSQMSQTRAALKNISSVANIKFVEVNSTKANIPIVNIHPDKPIKAAGYAHIPSARNLSPVCINADVSENLTPTH